MVDSHTHKASVFNKFASSCYFFITQFIYHTSITVDEKSVMSTEIFGQDSPTAESSTEPAIDKGPLDGTKTTIPDQQCNDTKLPNPKVITHTLSQQASH